MATEQVESAGAGSSASGLGGRWSDSELDSKRREADPVTDDVVAQIGTDREAVNELMRLLVFNDQPPPEQLPAAVKAYLERTLPLPKDADPCRIRRGQDFFKGWGPQICLALLCAALPASYAGSKQARILAFTGRLQHDVKRRIAETAQFVLDVMEPGSLEMGGDTSEEKPKGIRTIQKVRLMHATVRAMVSDEQLKPADDGQQPVWDDAWGKPINQEDLVAGMLCFSVVTILALQKLGVGVNAQEAEDYLYAWKVIGQMMGIQDTIMPTDMADARMLSLRIKYRHFDVSSEGQELARALVEMCQDLTPDAVDCVPEEMIVYLLGRRTARLLGLRGGACGRTFTLLRWLLEIVNWLESQAQGLMRLVAKAGLFVVRRTPLVGLDRFRARFAMPGFIARWCLGRRFNETTERITEAVTQQRVSQLVARNVSRNARNSLDLGRQMLAAVPLVSRKGNRPPFLVPNRMAEDWGIKEPARLTAIRANFDLLAPQHHHDVIGALHPDHTTAHRSWSMAQHRQRLLFAHCPVSPDEIRACCPRGVLVDTFDENAWITITVARLDFVQIRNFEQAIGQTIPDPLERIHVAEVSVRTYVRAGNRRGVLMLSTDTSDLHVCQLGQRTFYLPATYGDVTVDAEGEWSRCRCRRRQGDKTVQVFAGYYRPIDEAPAVKPDTLDHFLDERDLIYTSDGNGAVYRAETAHHSEKMFGAVAAFEDRGILRGLGIHLSGLPSLMRYAPESDLIVWPPERVT